MSLIRKNFVYNNLLGFTNILVPLIIFPYVSRILGPSGVGIPSFATSLTATFVILGSLGIPIYGIREIAKARKDKSKLSKTFSEIFVIQITWLFVTILIYAFWLFFTNTFKDELAIKYVSFLQIISVIGMFNWFFQGIENYKFITQINVLVKLLTIVLVFILIKQPEDYWVYYSIIVGTTFLGCVFSITKAFSYIQLKLYDLDFKKHLKPIGILFSTQLAIGLYINLDVLFLKYFSNDAQVGFYTAANKVVKASLMVVTSLGTVLIPKLSQLIQKGRIDEVIINIEKSIQFILLITFPIMLLLIVLSPEIILAFAGDKFSISISLMQGLTPLVFLIGMSNIFGLQILIPFNKDKQMLIAVVIGAILSVLLYITLIPKFKSQGAVFAIIITEFVITIIMLYYAKKTVKFKTPIKKGILYLLISLFFIPISIFFKLFFEGLILLSLTATFSIAFYFISLYLIKESFFINTILNPILKRN